MYIYIFFLCHLYVEKFCYAWIWCIYFARATNQRWNATLNRLTTSGSCVSISLYRGKIQMQVFEFSMLICRQLCAQTKRKRKAEHMKIIHWNLLEKFENYINAFSQRKKIRTLTITTYILLVCTRAHSCF